MTGVLWPDWLRAGKCKDIVNDYVKLLPKHDRDRLQPKIDLLGNDSDYVEFLRTEGEEIWERFLAELTRSGQKRNFTPLSSDEQNKHWTELDLAFDGAPPSAVPRNSFFRRLLDPFIGTISAHAQTARFLLAWILLGGGFLIIVLTYSLIPRFSRELYKAQADALKSDLSQDFHRIQEFAEGETFSETHRQLGLLERTLRNIGGSFAQFNTLAGELRDISSNGTIALSNLTVHTTELKVTKALLDDAIKLLAAGAAPSTPADPNTPPSKTPLEQILERLPPGSSTTPDNLKLAAENALTQLKDEKATQDKFNKRTETGLEPKPNASGKYLR